MSCFNPSANDPVDTTRFLDYPHKKEHIPGSFVKISDMWQYLKDFADDFDLHKYIQVGYLIFYLCNVCGFRVIYMSA